MQPFQPEKSMKSNCCLSTLITRSSDEGTSYYECKACGEPCDVAPQNQPPLDTGHHAEYDYKKNRTKRESEDNFISKTEHEKKIREAEILAWENGYQCGFFKLDIEKSRSDYLFQLKGEKK